LDLPTKITKETGWAYAEVWMAGEGARALTRVAAHGWEELGTALAGVTSTLPLDDPSVTKGGIVQALFSGEIQMVDDVHESDLCDTAYGSALRHVGAHSGACIPVGEHVVVVVLSQRALTEGAHREVREIQAEAHTRVEASIHVNRRRVGSQTIVDEGASSKEQSADMEAIMNDVFTVLVDKALYSPAVVYEELDWFVNHLRFNAQYFLRFDAKEIATHVQLLIAAKKTAEASKGSVDKVQFEAETDGGGRIFVCSDESEAIDVVEEHVEELINGLAGRAFSLAAFRSEGTVSAKGSTHLMLYIFDVSDFLPGAVRASENQIIDYDESSTLDVAAIGTPQFASKLPVVRERYAAVLQESHGRLSPTLVAEERPDGLLNFILCFRSDLTYLSTITEILELHNFSVERKFIETFANKMRVYSIYVENNRNEEAVAAVLRDISLMHCIPRAANLHQLFLDKQFTASEYAYATCVSRCVYYFLNQKSAEYDLLAESLANDPINLSRLEHIHSSMRNSAVPPNRIKQAVAANLSVIKELYKDFRSVARGERTPGLNEALHSFVSKEVTDTIDGLILAEFVRFNANVLKTNFFAESKSSVSFRLGPEYVRGFRTDAYGIFFIIGPDFQGFHCRMRDVARGGIRLIPFTNSQAYSRNAESQFNETFNLADTQNRKNKDIPEFGSKGTVLLYPHAPNTASGKMVAFQKYTAGLLDLLIPRSSKLKFIDHYGKEELLFLGPDEGTADMMEWAARYARRRNYRFWKSFTTGKPPTMGGVPHDTYGMTTRSVRQFKLGCLEKLGIKEEDATKVQTGGPDGDLGSNEILLSTDRTIAIVDGSGVLYDPAGLDRDELVRLAHKRVTINEFDEAKIGEGGFRVLTTDRDVTLPSGEIVESGLVFRNQFHLHPLATADMFIPCGGRPETVNHQNVEQLVDPETKVPKFKVIVEGANLFFTQEARSYLEDIGIVLYKDASANKGGVTSSSLEVLAALALTDAEHSEHMCLPELGGEPPEFYKSYVQEVQDIIESNARLEFEAVWREHERTGEPRFVLTDKISDKINELNDAVMETDLFKSKRVRDAVMKHAVPQRLQELVGLEEILQRVPENYLQAIFSCYIASRYVYKFGLTAPEPHFLSFMAPYLFEGDEVLSQPKTPSVQPSSPKKKKKSTK